MDRVSNYAVLPQFESEFPARVYKAPPIVERFVVLECEQSQQSFSQGMLGWKEIATPEFPVEDHQTRWELEVEEIDGVPVAESAEAVAKVTYVYRRIKEPVCSLITRPGIFRIGMIRPWTDGLTYSQFRPLAVDWGTRWLNHFDVKPRKIALRYINMLSQHLTPAFYSASENSLRVGDAITAFGKIPGKFKTIIPPYRCEASVLIEENADWQFKSRLKVHAVTFANAPAIAVEIQASLTAKKIIPDGMVFECLDLCHKAVNHQFECVFTEVAKQSFMPENTDDRPLR